MKAALIADSRWLARERGTLRRLIVGLMDESIRVVCITPESVQPGEAPGQPLLGGDQLTYRATRWAWVRDRQIGSLRHALKEAEPDVIHALDGSLARIARSLGEALQTPVVCGVGSAEEAGQLPIHERGTGPAYTAASRGLTDLVRHTTGAGSSVELVPPGVFATADESDPPLRFVGESLCCIVIGDGRFDPDYQVLLDAAANIKGRVPGAMYFFYSVGTDQHRLWQAAERRGLLNETSIVPPGADARHLLTQADAVLLPQPLGAVHTVVLEAMAAGRPVIATPDPLVDYLVEGVSAQIVARNATAAWVECLETLGGAPEGFVELGRSARRYVSDHHKASAFVERIKQIYERIVEPGAIPFR